MKEKRFTPGPWSYRKTGQHWNNPSLTNIEINFGNDGECIADTVYQEEDARLISAAPELLQALQACLPIWENHKLDASEASILLDCRAAIAKALGKE